MASLLTEVGADGPKVINQFITNFGALYAYQKVLAPYIGSDQDSEMVALLKSAGVVTAIEELKRVLENHGVNLDLFK